MRGPNLPTISQFFGILIRMFFDDHPPPHFHAVYNEHKAVIDIQRLEVIERSCIRPNCLRTGNSAERESYP